MTLRLKLSLSFLLVSLVTAAAVGLTAWWMLARDFREAARQQSFVLFRDDVAAYLQTYGSWEEADRREPLPEFIRRRHGPGGMGRGRPPTPRGDFGGPPGPPPPAMRSRDGEPPFRFLLLTPDGVPLHAIGDFPAGRRVPEEVFRAAVPVEVGGRVVLYASSQGETVLSDQDRAYLGLMERALVLGMLAGAAVAVVLGILFGGRLVVRLRELIHALDSMRPGDPPVAVPVRSADEIGHLADTFNRMSEELHAAHRELHQSNATISAQAERLREQSLRDPLTGLHNRRYFDEQLRHLFRHSRRYRRPLCVMLADLDHFKAINDRYSHAVGDAVLKAAARLLAANIRDSDLLARYGGEEFVAVFAESTLAQARERCEELRRGIESANWSAIAPGLRVTVSIGLCDELALPSPEAMLDAADRQLYRAKDGGRNRVEPAPAPTIAS